MQADISIGTRALKNLVQVTTIKRASSEGILPTVSRSGIRKLRTLVNHDAKNQNQSLAGDTDSQQKM